MQAVTREVKVAFSTEVPFESPLDSLPLMFLLDGPFQLLTCLSRNNRLSPFGDGDFRITGAAPAIARARTFAEWQRTERTCWARPEGRGAPFRSDVYWRGGLCARHFKGNHPTGSNVLADFFSLV